MLCEGGRSQSDLWSSGAGFKTDIKTMLLLKFSNLLEGTQQKVEWNGIMFP